jgi:superfamily I DNA/RNA helicase
MPELDKTLLDCLAEQAFPEFRDHRTPIQEILDSLLETVSAEIRQGRLVFDDLGALFWRLLNEFPTVDLAYRQRYPIVVADEHQDASALQDALVRRLGKMRLLVFADPMQLIHGYRGADPERLQQHEEDCDARFELRTPHRWHGQPDAAEWLLAVRSRIEGGSAAASTPSTVGLALTNPSHGWNGMKSRAKLAVLAAFRQGASSVAVLTRNNAQVSDLRSYFARNGLFPRQLGGDFEEARQDVEQLPLLQDPQSVAKHAIDRLAALVPTLQPAVLRQCHSRCEQGQIRLANAGVEARFILEALQPLYTDGPRMYLQALVQALEACAAAGHGLPRPEAVRALRWAADVFGADEPAELSDALNVYAEAIVRAGQVAPGVPRGLYVMTAHQSKGKEFDAVIIADASAQFWPDKDDNRLLFYVALTRATAHWTVVAPEGDASPFVGVIST